MYLVFIASMVFVVACVAIGISSNLSWRYRDLDVPIDRPESLSDLDPLQLRDCLTALERMHNELVEQVHRALTGAEERDLFLARWKKWSKDWRKRFEKLGVSCRLTEYRYENHPALGLQAEIYRLLEYFQRYHDRQVKRFATENARPLRELRHLFNRAKTKIVQRESQPVESPP